MHAVTLLSLLNKILLHGFLCAAQCWPMGIVSNSSAFTPLNSKLHNLKK